MMYVEHPFLERFAAAAADGFAAVEYLFPYDWPADTLTVLAQHLVLMGDHCGVAADVAEVGVLRHQA